MVQRYWLLFQKPQHPQSTRTPVPGDPTPYSALYRHCPHRVHRLFLDRVSLYSPGCPGAHSDQPGLELKNPHASASLVLELKASATTPRTIFYFKFLSLLMKLKYLMFLYLRLYMSLLIRQVFFLSDTVVVFLKIFIILCIWVFYLCWCLRIQL